MIFVILRSEQDARANYIANLKQYPIDPEIGPYGGFILTEVLREKPGTRKVLSAEKIEDSIYDKNEGRHRVTARRTLYHCEPTLADAQHLAGMRPGWSLVACETEEQVEMVTNAESGFLPPLDTGGAVGGTVYTVRFSAPKRKAPPESVPAVEQAPAPAPLKPAMSRRKAKRPKKIKAAPVPVEVSADVHNDSADGQSPS